MILTKEVEMYICSPNINYYQERGYLCKHGTTIKVAIRDLPLTSHSKIECVCQNCKNVITLGYHNYNKNINNCGIYYCYNCKKIKMEKTNIIKYGVKCTFLEKNTKEKIKLEMLKKYGVEYPYQSKEIMIKSSVSNKKTYKEHENEIIVKKKKTSRIKYGCDFPQSSEKVKENIKSTFMKNYNVENCFQSETIKNKIKKTCLDKYGDENYSKTNDYKNKIKLLNIDYKPRLEKMKKTCLERYGVEYSAQNIDIFNKTQKSQLKIKYYKNIKYQGTYELNFLIFCDELNILNELTKIKSLRYIYDNKNRIYYPDFYIKKLNLIIEIKSDYYYNLCLEKNLCKEKYCFKQDYDFMFIINKNYDKFIEKIKGVSF
jgi:hypothetical protein